MGRIKSALELALERTESVSGGKESLERREARLEGKRIAGAFLDDPEKHPIAPRLDAVSRERLAEVRRGAFDVLVAQVNLPANDADITRLKNIGRGLSDVIRSPQFDQLFGQLDQAMAAYLDETAQYDAALRKQYLPKLRQKEEELSRRTGRQVSLDPMQDPEFVAFYNQYMSQVRDRYQQAIDQVRAQAASMAGFAED